MAAHSGTPITISQLAKYLALLLIVVGLPTCILDSSKGAEMPLLVGLFMLLIVGEKIQDERVLQIKITSLYFAFIISYGVKLLTSNFYDHAWISFQLVEINHFLIMLLALANLIFYVRLYVK